MSIKTSGTKILNIPVHLVGSIPLKSSEAVFDAVGRFLGDHCKRIPDGETGVRKNWIGWQQSVFADQSVLIRCDEKERDYQLNRPFRFKEDRVYQDLQFNDVGFAREAIRSFTIFEQKQQKGVLPSNAKFLVAIPTPFAPVYSFISYDCQEDIFPVYEAAILQELHRICINIPHHKLAIQWDVATEMSIFENVYTVPFKNEWEILIGRLSKLGNHVPTSVEMGYHLCYGSMNNRHWKEPEDLGMCVRVANALSKDLARAVNFFHMPVPVNRTDEAFFSPLLKFSQAKYTELYLGLVHDAETIVENRVRMEMAANFVPTFGISTECGLGRTEPEIIPGLLALHAKLATAI